MSVYVPPFLMLVLLALVAIWAIRRSFRPAPGADHGDVSFHRRSEGQLSLGHQTVRYSYTPPRRLKNGIQKRKISIQLQRIAPVTVYLYAQTRTDEWLFRYGFSEELMVGIPWLDHQFNISTSDEDRTRQFLSREDVQQSLRQMISPAFLSFSIEPKATTLVLEDFDPNQYENLEQMVLGFGMKISELTPVIHDVFQHSSLEKAVKLSRSHQFLSGPVFGGFLIVALIAFYMEIIISYRMYEPVHALDTLISFALAAVGLILALVILLRPWLRKIAYPGREIKRFALLFLLSVWTMTFSGLLYANVKMDKSPAQKVSDRVLRKWISHSSRGNTTHYLVSYEAPTPAHFAIQKQSVESELSYPEWQSVQPGRDFIHLEIRQGYLGAAWIQAHWFSAKNDWSE
jgi:hypothetical protein